jgi:isopenicillin N synthase-like dioxygenase
MSNRRVPELSLFSYTKGNNQNRQEFIDLLFKGLKDYGFIVLTEHLVEQKKVDEAYKHLETFFNLPLDTKMSYTGVKGGQRGYTPFKTEHAKDNKNPDLKEFWHVGRELPANHRYSSVYPQNIWPKEIPEFKNTMEVLYAAMDQTSQILLEAIGAGLDLPKTFFKDFSAEGNSIVRAIKYPPVTGQDTKNCVRSAAHGDINLITLLVGATASGLQLLDRDGSWLDVQSAPGQIVVDTGDMMARLTNDVLPSTIHRVVNPDDEGSTRYSMPFFVHPNPDAMITCLPSCVGAGAKYAPISSHDFLMERLRQIGLY